MSSTEVSDLQKKKLREAEEAPPDDKESEQSDGGFGWVIVFAAFMIHVIVDGISFTFGVFSQSFKDYFNASESQVSLVGSLQAGTYLLVCTVVAKLIDRFGCRPVAVVGAVFASVAFVASRFSPNMAVLTLTYGFMASMAFGLLYLPSIIAVSHYFNRRRPLATGIATCGTGIGMLVFAPLGSFLLNALDWKNAVLIIAGIALNGAVIGMMLRPQRSEVSVKLRRRETIASRDIAELAQQEERASHMWVGSSISISSAANIKFDRNVMLRHAISRSRKTTEIVVEDNKEADDDVTETSRMLAPGVDASRASCAAGGGTVSLKYVVDPAVNGISSQLSLNRITVSGAGGGLGVGSQASLAQTALSSLSNMGPAPTPTSAKDKALRVLNTVLDVSLLQDPVFILLIFANFLAFFGALTPFKFQVDRAVALGVAKPKADFLVSVTGISNMCGRVFAGIVGNIRGVNNLLLHNIAVVSIGICCLLNTFSATYPLMCAFSTFFGFGFGIYIALTSVIMCQLLGLERLNQGFGFICMIRGFAFISGPPTAGAAYDALGDYDVCFYIGGASTTLGGMLFCLLHLPFFRQKSDENLQQDASMNVEVEVEVAAASTVQEISHSPAGAIKQRSIRFQESPPPRQRGKGVERGSECSSGDPATRADSQEDKPDPGLP